MEQNDGDSGVPSYFITPEDESGRQLLQRYLARRREELDQLRDALACGDYDLIRRVGHNLRGSGASYGLVRVSALGEQLELAAGRRSSSDLVGAISQLEVFVNSVILLEPI